MLHLEFIWNKGEYEEKKSKIWEQYCRATLKYIAMPRQRQESEKKNKNLQRGEVLGGN